MGTSSMFGRMWGRLKEWWAAAKCRRDKRRASFVGYRTFEEPTQGTGRIDARGGITRWGEVDREWEGGRKGERSVHEK